VDTSSLASTGRIVEPIAQASMYEPLERLAIVARYETEQPIYRYGDPAEHWFRIVSGAARKSSLSGEGQRHIVDFLLPGDFFGFSVWGGHQFDTEAIAAGTLVARYSRSSVEGLADSDPQIARYIRRIAFASIVRLQRRTVLLGRSRALEKVSAFLLEMADRSCRERTDWMCLPMSRSDIADYLAMAVETVSRTLTTLRSHRAIAFRERDARQVQICDPMLLEQFANQLEERRARSQVVRRHTYAQSRPL
jgi:CRP/FNR family transcriptional regulator, nitrogen fixation regulation protein